MINRFRDWLKRKKDDPLKKPSKKIRYLMVLGLVGLLLIIVSHAFSTSPKTRHDEATFSSESNQSETHDDKADQAFSKADSKTSNVDELEDHYEKDLETMLNKIQGVSHSEVMVNLDSTKVKVYEKDLVTSQQTTDEADKNGGERKEEDDSKETKSVLVRQGDKEVPLLIRTKKPNVRGVFIVAKGVEQASVKKWVIESVARVLDVPTHKVSVMPKK